MFPRHILVSRLKEITIAYRPHLREVTGREQMVGAVLSAETVEEFYGYLKEFNHSEITAIVDYNILDPQRTGIDLLRDVIRMAETDPDFIPPHEMWVQKHPIEDEALVDGLMNRMARLRKSKLSR